MELLVRLLYLVLISFAISCSSPKPKRVVEEDDFSLDGSLSAAPLVEDGEYYDDLEESSKAIPFKSSFPVGISVDNTPSDFELIPQQAKVLLTSNLLIKFSSCSFTMKTSPVQVHRFLYNNGFVKYGAEHVTGRNQRLPAFSEYSFQMSSQLNLTLNQANYENCKKLLYGRKTYIGLYHLQRSPSRLIPSPGSPIVKVGSYRSDSKGSPVFVHWHRGQSHPQLKNEMDFPATVESHFFHLKFSSWGFYYLGFRPILRSTVSKTGTVIIPVKSPK